MFRIKPPWSGYVLSFLVGCSLPFAFAPFSLFPLAVIALAFLLALWQNVSPWTAFWRGLFFGIGMFGVGTSWIYVSLSQFGHIPFLPSLLVTFLFILLMASYLALLGGGLNFFFPNAHHTKWLLGFPSGWVLIEWLRGWFLTGFPWLSIGYSQIDSPLSGFAPLIGLYGITGFVALSAGLLVAFYQNKHLVYIYLPCLFLLWGGGKVLSQVEWTESSNHPPLKVALLQGNIPQDFKWLQNYQLPTLDRYVELTQAHQNVDLIVWPETAIPVFYHQVPELIDYLNEQHRMHQLDFLIGIPVLNEKKEYFNAVMSISHHPGFYYKRHLVPFGEYIPFYAFLGKFLQLLDVPMSEFSAGADRQENLYSSGQYIGISICYEDVVSELVRSTLPEATLLVNVSNDAWFGHSIAPHQHLEIARMRALESGRYLLRATNTGISAIIDPKGRIVAQAPQFQIDALKGEVQAYQGLTPYIHFGDQWIIIFFFFTGLTGKLFEFQVKRK